MTKLNIGGRCMKVDKENLDDVVGGGGGGHTPPRMTDNAQVDSAKGDDATNRPNASDTDSYGKLV